ncbi:esterase-like activity of phytase family protein [Halomonas huangheensis]|uniref:Phytase-like domain-containing protein n=1 Tax=Halomonas huangheensis TaxID=1178482 RepID=W1N6N9_9GAMM|nr:esterase-like activity of phytase family protein [Halomonas huangheensis]ALM51062.1 hypothetical protein AR456_01195 [Halomonas huangheensis]ERL51184.1 hypothetical protein BJB45_14885 [Halomonas huangheensis]
MLKPLHTLALAGLLWSLPGCAHNVQLASLAGANAIDGKTPTIPGLELCGTLKLPSQWPADSLASGQPLGGLSALAWDDDEQSLWLISDRGRLHQTRPLFDDGQLIDLAVISSHTLKDSSGQPLTGGDGDAEAVVLDNAEDGERGNTALLIAFERDHRLQSFTTEGYPNGDALHPSEAQRAGQTGSGNNRGMEAMTQLPDLGVLIGLESPPPGSDAKVTRLFSLDGRHQWGYPLADATGSSLTDMAPWPDTPDTLLTLERAYAPPHPLVITLKRTQLLAPPDVNTTTVASLSSADGWRLDNMEGLAALPDGSFLMLSDNNFSRLQRSLLACLRPETQ